MTSVEELITNNKDTTNELFNKPITSEEITIAIKRLRWSKAFGEDYIINECIKYTVDIMMPVYMYAYLILLLIMLLF